jgi:release factor glutamine methyltransferase
MIYSPEEDSHLLAEQVKKYALGKKVLDMGAGSGIQAQTALKAKAKSVLACDINNESVNYIIKLGIEATQSDLFEKISGCFDLIIFNPPYLPEDKLEDRESSLNTSGGERGDEIILRFLQQAEKHLNPAGIILLLLSSVTPISRIKTLLKHLHLIYSPVSSKRIFFEELLVWKIEKA